MANPITTAAANIPGDKVNFGPVETAANQSVSDTEWNAIRAFADAVVAPTVPGYVAAVGTIEVTKAETRIGSSSPSETITLPDGTYDGQRIRLVYNPTAGGSLSGKVRNSTNHIHSIPIGSSGYVQFDSVAAAYADLEWLNPATGPVIISGGCWVVTYLSSNAAFTVG